MAETKENSLSKTFVGFVLERASAAPKIKDTGFVARMKRADNPDLEYQVWNILLKFNVDIEFNNHLGKEYSYRATFRTETLTQILDYLAKSANLKWKILTPEQREDDTFTKTKIIVDLY